MPEGFQALEDLLAVLQRRQPRMHGDRAGSHQRMVVPAGLGRPDRARHVVDEVAAEPRVDQGGCDLVSWGAWDAGVCGEGSHGRESSGEVGRPLLKVNNVVVSPAVQRS